MNLKTVQQIYEQGVGKRNHLKAELESIQETYTVQKELFQNLELTQALVQKVALETQSQLKIHIENIVQMALDAVFPNRYQFKVQFEMKRNKTEANIYLLDGENEVDPMSSCGGGVIDIMSLALRITVYTLSRTRNVIILDEPMRFVSRDLQPQAAEMIKKLSEHLGIQFIIVTHSSDVIESADKTFTVQLKEGVSSVAVI